MKERCLTYREVYEDTRISTDILVSISKNQNATLLILSRLCSYFEVALKELATIDHSNGND